MKKDILWFFLLSSSFAFAMEYDVENPPASSPRGSIERAKEKMSDNIDAVTSGGSPMTGMHIELTDADIQMSQFGNQNNFNVSPMVSRPSNFLSDTDSQEMSRIDKCLEACCERGPCQYCDCCLVSSGITVMAGLVAIMIFFNL